MYKYRLKVIYVSLLTITYRCSIHRLHFLPWFTISYVYVLHDFVLTLKTGTSLTVGMPLLLICRDWALLERPA